MVTFFSKNIPPIRPVLLIHDGHASHISIEAIEFARTNNIHILCLPAHTTHVLQPLDVGVFKSFKSNFSKACTHYIAKHPGRVITPDVLASLVAEAWPTSFTVLNIMSGFKKCGLFPFNPSAVDDRQSAPSKAFQATSEPGPISEPTSEINSEPLFTKEQESLYSKRYQEGYDLDDPSFVAWLKINHPDKCVSVSSASTLSTGTPPSDKITPCNETLPSSCSSDILSEVLVLPNPQAPKRKRKTAVNCKAVCITDSGVLEELKEKDRKKIEENEMKDVKKREKEEKKREREEKRSLKQKEKEERKRARDKKRKQKEEEKEERIRVRPRREEETRRGKKVNETVGCECVEDVLACL